MAVNSVLPPYPIFSDADGKPLEGGFIYIGEPGFEARSTPKASFFDAAMSIPTGTAVGAAVRTRAGYPVKNGAPAMIYVDNGFSVTVINSAGVVVYTSLNRTFELGNPTSLSQPILAPDGSLAGAAFGYINEPTTGRIRPGAGSEQDIVLGVPVSQRTVNGTEFIKPVTGAGLAYLTPTPTKIINGDMAVWQRGTSSGAGGVQAADRWYNGFVGGASTISQQAFTAGDQLGLIQPRYFLRQAVSGQSLASQYAVTSQRIESVRSFAGQTITILFYAKRSAGAGNLAVDIEQNFGTGGSPSASVFAAPVSVAIDGVWTAYKATFAVPSIIGKTIGSNDDDYLGINIWTSAGANFNSRTNSLGIQTVTVDLWGIHERPGDVAVSVAGNYVPPILADNLARCARYFQFLFSSVTVPVSTVARFGLNYFAPMRAVPTMGIATTGSANFTSIAAATIQAYGGSFAVTAAAGGTCTWAGNFSMNAEL